MEFLKHRLIPKFILELIFPKFLIVNDLNETGFQSRSLLPHCLKIK